MQKPVELKHTNFHFIWSRKSLMAAVNRKYLFQVNGKRYENHSRGDIQVYQVAQRETFQPTGATLKSCRNRQVVFLKRK